MDNLETLAILDTRTKTNDTKKAKKKKIKNKNKNQHNTEKMANTNPTKKII